MNQEANTAELEFLLRSPVQTGTCSPVEFLSDQAWGGIKVSTSPPLLVFPPDTCLHAFSRVVPLEFKHGAVFNTTMQLLPASPPCTHSAESAEEQQVHKAT